ncbi:MAG TPA: FHA domain-containing protein, partial [Acidobacteriaceae bacterium]|nr:FHA domain-containing protein [Acidobacteriaceae bacterium]
FCEVCGYNFATGAHGEVGILAPPPPTPAPPPPPEPMPESVPEQQLDAVQIHASEAKPQAWSVVVSVDPSLRSAESPDPPTDVMPFTIDLAQPVNLIGRTNEARAIFPEIALPHDEAVSRRHALLQLDAGGALSVRDIGAANGTRLNGKELQPMVDYPLHDGDELTLGHWSRIKVQAH